MRENGEEDKILWADVGEKLDLSIDMMKKIRAEYGKILGLTGSRKVARRLLPVIHNIAGFIRDGMSREEIEKKIFCVQDQVASTAHEPLVIPELLVDTTEFLKQNNEVAHHDPCSKRKESGTTKLVGEISAVLELAGDNMFSIEENINDVKAQVNYNAACQRESIARLTLAVQRLTQEVRDLRYCMVLAATRRDRKRGYSGLSSLLSGKP